MASACSLAPWDKAWAPLETLMESEDTSSADSLICRRVLFKEAVIFSMDFWMGIKSPI